VIYETIQLEIQQSLAVLALNRPDRLNAVNATMRRELLSALDCVGANSAIRCLLITGSGKAFCAGQDLTERRRDPEDSAPDLGLSLAEGYNPIVRKIKALQIPVVCAVNGVAAGAGANLALACDIVVSKISARFIQSFSNIGLIPDCGGTWSLTHKIGQARATALAMTGEAIDAKQAEEWGLIWKCYTDEEFEKESLSLAQGLSKKPTQALAATKLAIDSACQNTFPEQLELEANLQRRCGFSNDYQEGIQAFFEKRKPEFSGSQHS
jgi:2-(1,2-epoxy-1,2-dihydrophenyl)acetyl-CoA isomerase